MQAGKLRHRLTFQRRADQQDDYGESVVVYEDAFTVSASLEPLSGRELFAAQQVQSEVTTRVRIRYRSGFDSTFRIKVPRTYTAAKLEDEYYDIQSVIEDNKTGREWITLLCVKRAADGWRKGPTT